MYIVLIVPIWGNNCDSTSKQISITQNKAIIILYRQQNRTNVDNIYKEQHILTFKELIFYNACKIMFSIKNYQISLIIINVFKLQDSTYNMRDNKKIEIPLVKGISAGSQLQCQLSLIIALARSQPINNY